MARILGIDLGTNSLGWALIDDETQEVIDVGVRIFPEGYENLGQGDKEVTRNVQRRVARLMRRQIERRRRRKIKLLNWLKKHDLFPWDRMDTELTTIDPFHLRSEALQRKLEPQELGLALYHLNQRRGFLSNSKKGFTSEKSVIFTGDGDAVGMKKTIEEQGFDPETMTFGYFLDGLPKHDRKRARYAMRKWYRDEFDRLWTAQQAFYPDLLTEANREVVGDKIIFFQRPLKSQKDKVGFCEFEKQKRRAPSSCHDAQKFRMMGQVNNLMIEHPGRERLKLERKEGEDSRTHENREKAPTRLTATEQKKIYDYLSSRKELKIEDLGKTIGIPKEYWKDPEDSKKPGYSINLRGLKKLSGCRTRSDIREAIGDANYKKLTESDLEIIWQIVYDYQYDMTAKRADFFAAKIQRRFGWDEKTIGNVAEIALEDGYSNLSRKALRNINPFLEEGFIYSEACSEFTEAHPDYPVKYHHSDKNQRSEEDIPLQKFLPKPPDVRNPMVNTCLQQVRLVVNAIMRKYGRLDKIRMELGREMNQNKEQRNDAFKDNRKREDLNMEARHAISEIKNGLAIEAVSKSDIIRYKMWLDQGKKCAYTGTNIELSRLFGKDIDIDHILPLSLSQDDSFLNKVVCIRSVNAEKGQRTPFQAFGHDGEKWSGILERTSKWHPAKKRRMLTEDTSEFGGFRSNQLVATRYATRASLDYLRQVCRKVEPVNGQFTATLREVLGLNSVKNSFDEHHSDLYENPYLNFDLHPKEEEGKKSRMDHRHHTIDAVVVALSEIGLIQRANKFMGRRMDTSNGNAKAEMKAKLAEEVINWPDLVKQVKDRLACTVVSFKKDPIDKVQGKMHLETVYGLLRNTDGSPQKDEKGSFLYVCRQKVSSMKDSNGVEKIVDPIVKHAVREFLREKGINVDSTDKKGKYKYSFKAGLLEGFRHPFTGHAVRAIRVISPGERRFSIRKPNKSFANYENAYVQSAGIHHEAIFRGIDSKGRPKQTGYVMTLMEAYQRREQGLPTLILDHMKTGHFQYALNTNDLFLVLESEAEVKRWKQHDWSQKISYSEVWDKVYRVQYFDQTGRIGFRHHSLSKTKITDSHNIVRDDVGRKFKTVNNVTGLKLKIDPAGFITLAEE